MYYWADEGRQFMKKLDYVSFSIIYFIRVWRLHMQLRKWTQSSSWQSSQFCLHGCDIGENYEVEANIFMSAIFQFPPHSHTPISFIILTLCTSKLSSFFFKLFSQIECDVELITPVRQGLEDTHRCGVFIPLGPQLPPHYITEPSAPCTPPSLIPKERCALTCTPLSEIWLLLLCWKYPSDILQLSPIFFPASRHYAYCYFAFSRRLLLTTSLPSFPLPPEPLSKEKMVRKKF